MNAIDFGNPKAIVDQVFLSFQMPGQVGPPPGFQSFLVPALQSRPWIYIVGLAGPGVYYVFIGGAPTVAAGAEIWSEYQGTGLSNLFGSLQGATVPYYQTQANNLLQSFAATAPPYTWFTSYRPIVHGYSAGGGVAYWFIQGCLALQPNAGWRPNLQTFGSPKFGGAGEYNGFLPGDSAAWFLSDDPVPAIPPPLGFWTRIWAGLSVWSANHMQLFRPWPGGVQIDLNGNIRAVESPTQLQGDPVGAIENWIAATSQGTQTSHTLLTYQSRIDAAVPPASPPGPPIRELPAPNVTPLIPVTQIRQAITAAVETQFTNGAIQNAQPVVIPPEQAFSHVKIGLVYYTTFGGVPISAAPHKKGARALARTGNLFLRTMQNKGFFDTTTFQSQLQAYFELATEAGNGFAPLMIE